MRFVGLVGAFSKTENYSEKGNYMFYIVFEAILKRCNYMFLLKH